MAEQMIPPKTYFKALSWIYRMGGCVKGESCAHHSMGNVDVCRFCMDDYLSRNESDADFGLHETEGQ